jgi:lipoprotein-releasing system permease protein
MLFETFVARRYFSSGRFFTSVSTWITILGVTVGVAAVCIAVSLSNGFASEIRSRLLGTTSHISIFPTQGQFIPEYQALLDRITRIDGVRAASPFILYKVAISSPSAQDGIGVRGIDLNLEAETSDIKNNIVFGKYSFTAVNHDNDTLPGILIGKNLADRLGTFIDQPLVMYAMSGEEIRTTTRPRVKKFLVTGIFETGMFDFDGQLAYISLPEAQDLFRTGDAVTAVHLKVDDIELAGMLAKEIDEKLDYQYDVVPWEVLHKNLFSWIEFEKLILFLGFILIVLVAAFSIISTLVMTTMEKRAEIGILKTMGSTPLSVSKIFVLKGMMIGIGGVLGGWLLAAVIAYVQNTFKLISLPPDIFFIKYVPIKTEFSDFMFAGGVTLLICFLASLYPAIQAARTSVIEVLRQ